MQWTVCLPSRREIRWKGTPAWSVIGVSQNIPRCRTVRALCITKCPVLRRNGKTINTERNEVVNLSRGYGRALPEPNRAVAWLKTTITSDRKETKKVDIGWTRELWVFVNGKLVYADKNLFEQEGARKAPDGRCSLENGAFTLPLEAGENEVAVAIANNFYGWGLMLRLADPEGVHLAGSSADRLQRGKSAARP